MSPAEYAQAVCIGLQLFQARVQRDAQINSARRIAIENGAILLAGFSACPILTDIYVN